MIHVTISLQGGWAKLPLYMKNSPVFMLANISLKLIFFDSSMLEVVILNSLANISVAAVSSDTMGIAKIKSGLPYSPWILL